MSTPLSVHKHFGGNYEETNNHIDIFKHIDYSKF